MSRRIYSCAGVAVALGLCAAPSAQAGHGPEPSRQAVAVYTQTDPESTETVTLYADGKYRQTETERDPEFFARLLPHRSFSLPELAASFPIPKLQRDGTWRVLDGPGGTPVALETGAGLPPGATVELKGAMPFGLTWENQRPYALRGDRSVPAALFQSAAPAQAAPDLRGKRI